MLGGRRSSRYLTQPDGGAIWLWRSHNRANRHLRGDVTEDPTHPKVQFPVAAACSMCHRGSPWNESAVLQYLVDYYGAANIIDDDVDNGAGMKLFGSSASHSRRHSAWLLHGLLLALQIVSVLNGGYFILPYLTFGPGWLLHLPSDEAVSVQPNAQPRCNRSHSIRL